MVFTKPVINLWYVCPDWNVWEQADFPCGEAVGSHVWVSEPLPVLYHTIPGAFPQSQCVYTADLSPSLPWWWWWWWCVCGQHTTYRLVMSLHSLYWGVCCVDALDLFVHLGQK